MIVMPWSSSSCLPLAISLFSGFWIKGASRGQSRHTYCLLFTIFLQLSFLSFTNLWTKCRRSATWRSKALVCSPKAIHQEARQAAPPKQLSARFRWCTTYTSILYLHLCCILIENSQDGALFLCLETAESYILVDEEIDDRSSASIFGM